MKEGTQNLLVGTFVVGALAVFAVLMIWFGEAPSWLGGSEWELRITGVTELSGLDEGSTVILNGVEIGRVKRLEFEDPSRPHQGVVIVAGIKNTYYVPQGALARIYGATLGLGSGHIEVVCEPVSEAEPLDREFAVIRGEMGSTFGELISGDLIDSIQTAILNIGTLAGSTKPVMDNLAALTEQRHTAEIDRGEQVVPTVGTVIERLDILLANLNTVVGDEAVQGDVKSAIGDLRTAASRLREVIGVFNTETQRTSDNLNTGIEETKKNLDESFGTLNRALGNLDDGLTTLARMLQHVESGEGTAGKFVHDDRLYEAAVIALERIGELAGTLQRIFGKAEEEGVITIGKVTPIGIISKDVPLEEFTEAIRKKLGLNSAG